MNASKSLRLFEIALMLVRLDHVTSVIAETENASLCTRMKSWLRFVELESAVGVSGELS
jgi:hypothetical protein